MAELDNLDDVLWILIAAAFVLLMQGGFIFLESGFVRAKNSINVAIKNFADFCLSTSIFWVFGFALMFGTSAGGWFGTSGFFFGGAVEPWLMAFFIFQLVFCGTATTIVSGAVAERMRFSGYLIVSLIIASVIYPIIGHWVWGGLTTGTETGWLARMGFIDFAGSTVVHSVGGWMALAAVLVIGPRIGRFDKGSVKIQGHNLPMATLGAMLLWFGWFGFNGGSTLALTEEIPFIIANTTMSGVFGGATALLASWYLQRNFDVGYVINGALAGLVAITASANIMTVGAAVIIGIVGGLLSVIVTIILERFKVDDAIGAVPVHAVAGVWGTLAVALLSNPEMWGTGLTRMQQFAVQATGVFATFIWAFGLGFSLLWAVNHYWPLRVSQEEEQIGLNVAEHGVSTEMLDVSYTSEQSLIS
ncbi:MAG: ammonium transporter [Chloroflexota bacterium]